MGMQPIRVQAREMSAAIRVLFVIRRWDWEQVDMIAARSGW